MLQACIYCGARAVRWCDLVIGFDGSAGGLATLETEIFRCDAPLCLAHADHRGNIFFCGSPAVAGVESIDHCCGHRDEGWRQAVDGEWQRHPDRFEPIDADEAERRRYRYRCLAAGGLKLV